MAAVTVWLYVLITFIATEIVNILMDEWRVGSNESISILTIHCWRTIDPGLSLVEM